MVATPAAVLRRMDEEAGGVFLSCVEFLLLLSNADQEFAFMG